MSKTSEGMAGFLLEIGGLAAAPETVFLIPLLSCAFEADQVAALSEEVVEFVTGVAEGAFDHYLKIEIAWNLAKLAYRKIDIANR